jgi:hypothetical protein
MKTNIEKKLKEYSVVLQYEVQIKRVILIGKK